MRPTLCLPRELAESWADAGAAAWQGLVEDIQRFLLARQERQSSSRAKPSMRSHDGWSRRKLGLILTTPWKHSGRQLMAHAIHACIT